MASDERRAISAQGSGEAGASVSGRLGSAHERGGLGAAQGSLEGGIAVSSTTQRAESGGSVMGTAGGGAGEVPPRPVERMSRLSSFRHRLSPASRDTSPSPASSPVDGTSPRRPRFSRRFSRSLTSLQASLLATCDTAQDDLEPSPSDEPDEGSKLARWRAKGKAKLAAAFKPPTLDSPPTSPSTSASPFTPSRTPELGRAGSRSRSHSAPLFLPRAPASHLKTVELEAPVAVAPAPAALDSASSSRPFVPLAPSPIGRCGSPAFDAFATCPSSPVGDAEPAFSSSPSGLAVTAERRAAPPTSFATLPHEVQLAVFAALVEVCEDEWRRDVREGRWIGKTAGERWSDGRARGRREVVKVGRVRRFLLSAPALCERAVLTRTFRAQVSKAWRALSLDGQLWATVPAASILGGEAFTAAGVAALLESAGDFVTTLDASGMGDTLDNSALEPLLQGQPTRLTKIDLTGASSSLTIHFCSQDHR